jgi:hypothetical protein
MTKSSSLTVTLVGLALALYGVALIVNTALTY